MRVLGKVLAVLALGVIMCTPVVTNASVVLSDILLAENVGDQAVTADTWVAASFGTLSGPYYLDSVTLLMHQVSSGTDDAARVEIYTNDSSNPLFPWGMPGSQVGALTSPTSYPTIVDDNVTFTGGITLNANSTYWVVLKALGGEFAWAFTNELSGGSGPGFQSTWGVHPDSFTIGGGDWFTKTRTPKS
jgi:hypothetical protein